MGDLIAFPCWVTGRELAGTRSSTGQDTRHLFVGAAFEVLLRARSE
jgi:hypothetical protein